MPEIAMRGKAAHRYFWVLYAYFLSGKEVLEHKLGNRVAAQRAATRFLSFDFARSFGSKARQDLRSSYNVEVLK